MKLWNFLEVKQGGCENFLENLKCQMMIGAMNREIDNSFVILEKGFGGL